MTKAIDNEAVNALLHHIDKLVKNLKLGDLDTKTISFSNFMSSWPTHT